MIKQELRNKIIMVLKEQGFKINPHVRPSDWPYGLSLCP